MRLFIYSAFSCAHFPSLSTSFILTHHRQTTLHTVKAAGRTQMAFLKEEQLAAMAFDHKYASSGGSLLDGLIMQKFWNHIVTWLPLKHNPQAIFHWLLHEM